MRKPLVALGLALSTSLGATPAVGTLAAAPASSHLKSPPNNSPAPDSNHPAVSGAAIVQTAMKYLGYPYTATGNSPSTGFSCIGFASFVYRSNGIPLPGDLPDALAYAPEVPFSNLEPGDLVFFQNTVWAGLSHVGIYIGGGKFIHAAWYNTGVEISSLSETYWTKDYLAANRPWTGAAVAPSVGTTTPPSGPATAPGSTATTNVTTGPTATVTVASLNVRSAPSKSASIVTVAPHGTTLIILAKKHGWYKVQMPNGVTGWVVGVGIGLSGPSAPSGSNGTVGNATAPVRTGAPTTTSRATVSVKVNGLRVHSGPSVSAPVVGSATRGQRVQVVGRHGSWLEIRLPNGTTGWIMASYTSASVTARSSVQTTARTSSTTRFGSVAQVAMNVRSRPSMSASIVTVIPAGASYRTFGRSHGWAHVQLPNGLTGWVSGSVLGTASASAGPTYHSYSYRHSSRTAHKSSSTGHSVLTAGVRVHARPGIKSAVITLAAAGTHVTVLRYGGWDLIRLPTRVTGYVLGMYVR